MAGERVSGGLLLKSNVEKSRFWLIVDHVIMMETNKIRKAVNAAMPQARLVFGGWLDSLENPCRVAGDVCFAARLEVLGALPACVGGTSGMVLSPAISSICVDGAGGPSDCMASMERRTGSDVLTTSGVATDGMFDSRAFVATRVTDSLCCMEAGVGGLIFTSGVKR